ncbi:ribonuclease J [Candidatus Woesebacteria bacterium]|nr:ribonuclease J [Candidatus Woesebacteria bacterium]
MSQLTIIPLGGMGNVTQNMFLYEYDDEIVIVDCGIGFPDMYMPGVDVLIPDISYLLKRLDAGKKIIGMVLSHGHDDHIAALPYLLPGLPEFPIYGSPLTAGFAEQRMVVGGVQRSVRVIDSNKPFKLSENFTVQLMAVTHSVPDTRHVVLRTPEGIIYHGSDFKLDPNPVDGQVTDLEHIGQLADEKVLCMMVDCLRVEQPEWVKSESTTGPVIDRIMAETTGTFVITLMSSHIHRIQQTVNAAEKYGRKVAFIGRSVEQNVDIATRLNRLHIPDGMLVDKRDLNDHQDSKLCLIVAGSQGQEGSSLIRAIYGDHPVLRIKPTDTVVFSADAIPGNEIPYFGAIDELSRNRVHVIYPDVEPGIHRSGHASAPEQQELVGLVKPRYVMPIGGADRHRVKFIELVAKPLGLKEDQLILPESGEVIAFENGQVRSVEKIILRPPVVDGLGIGDVGPAVLSDRRALSQAGMVVVVIPRVKRRFQLDQLEIASRGFVFMKEAAEVVGFIKGVVADTIKESSPKQDDETLIKQIERRLSRRLYKVIKREPLIVPVILDLQQ